MKKALVGAALGAVAAVGVFLFVIHYGRLADRMDGTYDPERDEKRFYHLHDQALQSAIDGKMSAGAAVDQIDMADRLFKPAKFWKDLREFDGTRRERIEQYVSKLLGQPGMSPGPWCEP